MLKKTIKYNTFDGAEVEEDFYFHLSKADIAKMQLSVVGDFHGYLKAIVEVGDPKVIIETFEEIIQKTIGQRTEDGKGFKKTKEITEAFVATEAYSNLFVELVTDANAASEFIRGVMPTDIAGKMPANPSAALEQAEAAARPKTMGEYTDVELRDMPKAEWDELMSRTRPASMTKDQLVIAMHRRTQE